MNDLIKESLSALKDGEASELEMHRLLKQMDEDESVRVTWQRYHAVTAQLDTPNSASWQSFDITAAVQAEIANEPGAQSQVVFDQAAEANHSVSVPWYQQFKGLAVAASIATVTVLFATGVESIGGGQGQNIVANAALNVSRPVSINSDFAAPQAVNYASDLSSNVSAIAGPTVVNAFELQQIKLRERAKLESYLMQHSQQARGASSNMVPMARVVSFASE